MLFRSEPPGADDAEAAEHERPRHGRGHSRGQKHERGHGGGRDQRGPKPDKRRDAPQPDKRRDAPQPAKRREAPPAPVTMLDEARGRRPAKPAAQPESGAESHLPAFLLRPTRVKA